MKNIGNKIDGNQTESGKYYADEFNSSNAELKTIITKTKREFDPEANDQLFRSIDYLSKLNYYWDYGANNLIHIKRAGDVDDIDNETYYEGMSMTFLSNHTNTGACTIYLGTNGNVVKLVNLNNSELIAHQIIANTLYLIRYDSAYDNFKLYYLDRPNSFKDPTEKIEHPSDNYAAEVYFKQGVGVTETLENPIATNMMDETVSKGIHSIKLVFDRKTQANTDNPDNQADFENLKTNNQRVYEFETNLTPTPNKIPRFDLLTSTNNLLYKWELNSYTIIGSGYAAPYDTRIVFRLTYGGLFAGLLLNLGNNDKNLYKYLIEYLGNIQPYSNEHAVELPIRNKRVTNYGGFIIKGANFLKIPSEVIEQS